MSRDRSRGERLGGSGPGGSGPGNSGRDREGRRDDGHGLDMSALDASALDAISEAARAEREPAPDEGAATPGATSPGAAAPNATSPGAAAREAASLAAAALEATALEAMVTTLEPEPLPLDGWERLRLELGTGRAARPRTSRSAAPDPGTGATMPPPSARGASPAVRWVVGVVLVAAVVVAGSWGALMAGEAASLRDDQRILAYWMANPDMRLVALSAPDLPAAFPAAGPARLGVVCVLPDGRALLLQPAGAPRGATYVVRGGGPGGPRELARGSGNMLQFDARGVQSVEVVVARGDAAAVVARAQLE